MSGKSLSTPLSTPLSTNSRVLFGPLLFSVCLCCSLEATAQNQPFKLSDYTGYENGDFEIKLNGRLMYDFDSYDGVYTADGTSTNDSELRRARLGFEADYNDWRLNYSAEYGSDDSDNESDESSPFDTKNAYLRYSGFDLANITVGQSKEPFGLDRMTSSRHISTIERSMATDAFVPGRSLGIKFTRNSDNYSLTSGVFESNDQSSGTTTAWTTRFTHTPWQTDSSLLHLGVAASYRDLGGARFDIDEPAEVHTAEDIVISDNFNNADHLNLAGLEIAFVSGPFSIQGEYFYADVEDQDQSANYSGSYLLGSYFLTGESRSYKNGDFGEIEPNSNRGAVELVLRYSELDANYDGEGDKGTALTLGLNYYLNENIRLMANYIHTEVTDEDALSQDGDAFSLRAQFSF